MQNGITLITPTGDRYLAFKLCEMWMSRQTIHETSIPFQWIVIDDGITRDTGCTLGQDYVKRQRLVGEPPHTLHLNLLVALPLIKYNHIMIIEDDDYYVANYVEKMNSWLDHNHAVGQGESIYYNIRDRNIRRLHNQKHVSLCQTGFTSVNIARLEQVCNIIKNEFANGNNLSMVDILFWRNAVGKKYIETGTKKLCIGIKGLPGRKGIGNGHNNFESNDNNFAALIEIMGEDSKVYVDVLKLPEYSKSVCNQENRIKNEGEEIIHRLLRLRHIRRLVNGDIALLRHNSDTLVILNKYCKKVDNKTWRIKRVNNNSDFTLAQKDRFKDKTCYIIGKGPGLDTIPFSLEPSVFKLDCPIVAVNEVIHTLESKYTHKECNPIFCIQQDTVLRETCWSKHGTMLVPFTLRWYTTHPKVLTYMHSDFEVQDKRFPFSVEMAILIAKCWGCSDIVFMGCDAAVTHNCDYAKAIGHEPMGKKERYLEHVRYINRALNGMIHTYIFPSNK